MLNFIPVDLFSLSVRNQFCESFPSCRKEGGKCKLWNSDFQILGARIMYRNIPKDAEARKSGIKILSVRPNLGELTLLPKSIISRKNYLVFRRSIALVAAFNSIFVRMVPRCILIGDHFGPWACRVNLLLIKWRRLWWSFEIKTI